MDAREQRKPTKNWYAEMPIDSSSFRNNQLEIDSKDYIILQ